jgi:hypothetical protein
MYPVVIMYETHWRTALLVYCTVFFIFAFALRSLLVYRRSGRQPSGAAIKR